MTEDTKPRVIILGGGRSSLTARLALALASQSFAVVQASAGPVERRAMKPEHRPVDLLRVESIKPFNDIKRLKREQRARETRIRKMLPKGVKR